METKRRYAIDDSLEQWSYEETSEDESEALGLVTLFGYDDQKLLLKDTVAPRYLPPGDPDYDTDDEMTDEQRRIYTEQVKNSAGFDVEPIPGVSMYGQIFPLNIEEKQSFNFDFGSQLAVDEYNRRYEDKNWKLEFVKVLKVMGQVVGGVMFFITFEAKDLADGDKIKIYQAAVFRQLGTEITVESFRLKPPEDEQGTGSHGNEWFWEDHLC